jgi:streptogramin lyase
MTRQILTFLVTITFITTLFAQEIAIGEWRDHLPYKRTISVAASDNLVYCATPYSLFYFDKNDNSINRFTSISGLNDIGVVKIDFNRYNNTLLVAYSNTNIDLVKGNVIVNMSDILNSNAITPEEKTISNIMFLDNLAYISCGFGIVVMDVDKEEIRETYYIGPNGSHLKVYDVTHNDTSFFAATENGIYHAHIDNPNLAYFGSWTKMQNLHFPNATYNFIESSGDKIFINKYTEEWATDSIFYLEEGTWKYDNQFINDDVMAIKSFDNKIYCVHRYTIKIFDENLNALETIYTYGDTGPLPADITIDEGTLWISDQSNGLVRQNGTFDFTFIYPDGPYDADVFDMNIQGGHLWIAAGGRNLSWGNLWKRASISSFIDGEWNTLNRFGYEAFDTIFDIVSVAVDPYDLNRVYAGSWSRGLVEFNNNEIVEIYTPENSSLGYKTNEGPPVCKAGGLVFDEAGNLWITNSGANEILSVYTRDGDWQSYYLGSVTSGKDIGQVIVNSFGQKWILWREDNSLVVFDDNGTIFNTSDDQVKRLSSNSGNGALPGSKVFSIAEDKDGEVWIGTDEGIAVFYSPENVFTNFNFDCQQILIPRNDGTGLADILLEFETITAIAVDGANNKWVGTDRSGVFKFSPDGQQELHHFTEENSPLFSNNITSIAINHETGEVFFGTSRGIISYKSTAVDGGTTNSDVYAYPNPVRPGYDGPIAVKGLVSNAEFKITDVSGTLVFSGRAEGGQAIWDGRNFSGRRAQTGVYLVFVSDEDGSEKLVTKILFIN